jgi:hypothetical protein
MTKTSVSCDRCHERIEAGRLKLVVQVGETTAGYADTACGWRIIDLCPSCRTAFQQWVTRSEDRQR